MNVCIACDYTLLIVFEPDLVLFTCDCIHSDYECCNVSVANERQQLVIALVPMVIFNYLLVIILLSVSV